MPPTSVTCHWSLTRFTDNHGSGLLEREGGGFLLRREGFLTRNMGVAPPHVVVVVVVVAPCSTCSFDACVSAEQVESADKNYDDAAPGSVECVARSRKANTMNNRDAVCLFGVVPSLALLEDKLAFREEPKVDNVLPVKKRKPKHQETYLDQVTAVARQRARFCTFGQTVVLMLTESSPRNHHRCTNCAQ